MNSIAHAQDQASLAIEVLIDSPLWNAQPNAETMLRRAVEEAAAALSTYGGELAIVLTDDSAIRQLNRQWRGIDAPTNVLSFPARPNPSAPLAGEGRAGSRAPTGKGSLAPLLLGDVVIAYETAAREATDEGKVFAHHLAHLAVHGFLHLLGYDHAADPEADAMEKLETAILARLGMPDPYRLREV
jgi:probable rRNA maturation factor